MTDHRQEKPETFFMEPERAIQELPLVGEDTKATMVDFIHVVNRFRRMFSRHYPREITQGEFMVLHAIEQERGEGTGRESEGQGKKGIRMTELTQMLGSSKSALSKSIRILEEKGYVKRWSDPKDKRNIYICLSEEGKRIFYECHRDMDAFILKIFERMGKEDMKELVRLLNQFYDIVQEERDVRKMHMTSEGESEELDNRHGRIQ